jgi:hypothetical protein
MMIWDAIKAILFALIALAIFLLLPFIMGTIIVLFFTAIFVTLIVGYVIYKKEERKSAKNYP